MMVMMMMMMMMMIEKRWRILVPVLCAVFDNGG